jgi:hypothetical protein
LVINPYKQTNFTSILGESIEDGEAEGSYEDEFIQDDDPIEKAVKPTPPNKVAKAIHVSSEEDDEAYSTSNKRSSIDQFEQNKDLKKSKDTGKDEYDEDFSDDFDDEKDSKPVKKSKDSLKKEIGRSKKDQRPKVASASKHSQKVSPRGGNKLTTKANSAFISESKTKRNKNMNRSMVTDFKKNLNSKLKVSPLLGMEMDMKVAKTKMHNIAKLRKMSNQQTDEHSRLVLLNRE